jgi:hypothetical protein
MWLRLLSASLATATALAASGCASNFGTSIPAWAGGEPPGLPAAAPESTTANYPNVYDVPPPRPTKLMSQDQATRTEAELAALRKKVNAVGDGSSR